MTTTHGKTKYGLTEKEARVYETLVELGPSRVSAISQRAGLNRTALYEIIQRLLLHGLIAPAFGVGKRRTYVAEHPSRLLTHLERQQRSIERMMKDAEEKIPELTLLYKTVQKPSIKFFEGTEGVKQIYEETLQSTTPILAIGDMEGWATPDLVMWGKNYNRRRAQAKIHERILGFETPATIEWLKRYPATLKYTEYRFIPSGQFPLFFTEINIYEDKIVVALLKQPNRMGILIHNQQLADILRAMFELIWQSMPAEKMKKQYAI